VVKGDRHSDPPVEVVPARASDHHAFLEERAIGADALVDWVLDRFWWF